MKNKFYVKAALPVIVMAMTVFVTSCGVLPVQGAGNTGNASKSVAKVSVVELTQDEQAELIRTTFENTLAKGEAIRKFCFEDFDRDGRPEAFILTGKAIETEQAQGEESDRMTEQEDYNAQLTLHFAYVQDGEVVSEKIRENVTGESDVLPLKSVSLFQCTFYCATGFPTDLYRVEGNQCKVIFHGDTMDIHTNVREANATGESDDFQSVASTYDAYYDSELEMGTGHTWKPYYFHYADGIVTEYKGQEISLSKLQKEYSNAGQMLKKYQKKKEFLSAIQRENGIVHVNFVTRETGGEAYSNVTFQVVDGKLTEPVVMDGIYHTTIEEEGEGEQSSSLH